VLRLWIDDEGRVSDVNIVHETGDYGFGKACEKQARAHRWTQAAELKFRCDFELNSGP
jgi:hypothetical protein